MNFNRNVMLGRRQQFYNETLHLPGGSELMQTVFGVDTSADYRITT